MTFWEGGLNTNWSSLSLKGCMDTIVHYFLEVLILVLAICVRLYTVPWKLKIDRPSCLPVAGFLHRVKNTV